MNNNLSCNNDDTTQSRRNVRNTSTQTKARPCKCNDKKQIKSTPTQTFLTKDNILVQQKVTTPACFVSFGTQTEDASADVDHFHQLPPHENTNNTLSNTSIAVVHSSDEPDCNDVRSYRDDSDSDLENDHVEEPNFEPEFEINSDDSDEDVILNAKETQDEHENILLSYNKLPQDQLKFIVFEESLVKCFEGCFKCDSDCAVCLESIVGTFCKISITCSGDINHAFVWSTGPLHNRLPLFHLMITSGILSSGLESAKVLRLFDSLNIPCIKRREFTDLQLAYVIPTVVNVWNREKTSLVQESKERHAV